VHLKTWILFANLSITIPDEQYTISSDGSIDGVSQYEIYGTTEFHYVDQSTGAPPVHHILDYCNEEIVQFTRYWFIIDFISCSLLSSTNMQCNCTQTKTPGFLPSDLFPMPFDYFASVGEIELVECFNRHTLITPLRWLAFVLTIWWYHVSMLCKLLEWVLLTLQNTLLHWHCDVQVAHQIMEDSHLSHSRERVEITCSVINTTGSSIQ
jgi:hypothetical protein